MVKSFFNHRSLHNINMLKLIIYALSFVAFCMFLILFLLLPILKNYKEATIRANSQIGLLNESLAQLKFSEDRINKLRNDNNTSLSQFETKLNIANFQKFVSNFFSNVSVKENPLNEDLPKNAPSVNENFKNLDLNIPRTRMENQATTNKKEMYLKHRILVEATMQNPQSLYDFLNALKDYENLIKISSPFTMKAAQNTIKLSFEAKIYTAQ